MMTVPLAEKKDGPFTYADYIAWPESERWELIKGVAYSMTPAPSRQHQKVCGKLFVQIEAFLAGRPCEVYFAPFDVRLPSNDDVADDLVETVVQPDIVVVCDEEKLDDRGCRGAPDFIIEVVSPSTASRDNIEKSALYETHRVKEYWIVHPTDRLVFVRHLTAAGTFGPVDIIEATGTVAVRALPGLKIDLEAVFAG